MATPILDQCLTCQEGGYPRGECPKSRRDCGHHCNGSWAYDFCHWCGMEWLGDGETRQGVPGGDG